jgi:hypothetical protein
MLRVTVIYYFNYGYTSNISGVSTNIPILYNSSIRILQELKIVL